MAHRDFCLEKLLLNIYDMSYTKLLITIDSIESQSIPGIPDIKSLLLPTEEVVKNMLIAESGLSKEDAELMIYGFQNSKSIIKSEIEEIYNEGDTLYKESNIRKSVEEQIKEISDTDTGAPLSSNSPYHKAARTLLSTMLDKLKQFFRKIKELGIEIGSTMVSIVSSMPGASLMVSPFAFNVPGMITMLMQMISLLSMLRSKMSDLTSYFKHFKELHLVLSPKDLDSVSSLIDSSYKATTLSFEPLESAIEKFIAKSKSRIEKKYNEDKMSKKVTSRLRKLKYIRWYKSRYLIDIEYTKVDEDDIDEIEDILEQWDVININNYKVAVKRKQYLDINDEPIDLMDLISNLDKLTEVSDNISLDLKPSTQNDILYDVVFDGGDILMGLSTDEVEGLRIKYDVIYSPDIKFNYING